jgi:HK97 family phage major capsid protein
MFSDEYTQSQVDRKLRAHDAMKQIAERAKAADELSAEDRSAYDAAESEYNAAKAEIDRAVRAAELAKSEVESARPAFVTEARAEAATTRNDADVIRSLAMGEARSATFDRRAPITGSVTGSPVPTSFYDRLVELLVVQGPMLDASVTNVIPTNGGENLQVPRAATYTAGSITAQGSAITASEPTFSAFVTLGAFKYSALIQVSTEMLSDSGVDLLGFIADQAAVGIGTSVNAGLTTGTGTVQPNGIANGADSAVTGGTGVSGLPTYDNLVDLVYGVSSAARRAGATFQMNATTLAGVRKLKDTTNQPLWQPSVQAGEPDTLLGFPVPENPDLASGTGAKSIVFGDHKKYYVRQVGGIQLDRSDDYGFANGLVTFRGTWRGDGALVDSNAVKYFKGAAT